MNVGYVGLGALGSALAGRLLPKHPTLSITDISAEAVRRFPGGRPAESPAALAASCDVILMCLPRSSDVETLIFGPRGLSDGLAPGKLLIDQTSGIPAQTRAMADRLAQRGVQLIDAAVSGSPHVVVAGGASLMASGPPVAFEQALPVLNEIAGTVYRCGDRVGDGQAMKTVNNALNGGCRVGTLEIVALGRKMGLSLASMSDRLKSGPAANQTTSRMLPALVEGKSSTDFALALMTKDLSQAVALGIEFEAPMPICAAVRGLMQIGVNVIGPQARLEDIPGLVERMADVTLTGEAAGASDEAAALIERSVAALATALTYECVAAGLKYGLHMADMARILVGTSGWSEPLRQILPRLAAGDPPTDTLPAIVDDLQAAARAAIEHGAPTMVLNAVRGVAECARGEGGTLADFAARAAGLSFPNVTR